MIQPTNSKAGKWNYKKGDYEPYPLPEKATTFESVMKKKIACAQCKKEMIFGDAYTSLEIHTKFGMGYAVCEKCYYREVERERDELGKPYQF